MMRWPAIAVLAACGSGGAAKPGPARSGAASGGGAQVTAAAMRERVKTFCGAAFKTTVDGETGEGCAYTGVAKWRGAMRFETVDDVPSHVRIELSGPADDASAMRDRALEQVKGLLDDAETAATKAALARLFRAQSAEMLGYLGPLAVTAGTTFDPGAPEKRGVVLDLLTGSAGGRPLRPEVPASEFASPAKEVPATWLATAKLACTELANYVSKTHKIEATEPKWTEGELGATCVHANENAVAQFVISWAPGTRKLLYLRAVAEVPQKRFAALLDKLLVPLLTPEQTKVAKIAAKKEPLDRKFDADGLQMGSRHDSGGFYGETHEIEVSVQVGYGTDASGE